MTNPNRRSVAPVRKLLAAVLGVIAAFVMLFGAGMASWAIVALGAAMLVIAIGLAMVNVARRGARAWVAGTAHVRSVGEPPAGVAFGRCELQLVVAAPGLPAAAVTVRDPRVPVAKWPDPGATLPVMVAIDDMRRVRIQWDDVMTHAEAAVAEATEEYPDPAHDLLIEEFLSESEAPPWVTRDRRWADTDPGGDRSGPLGDRGLVVREGGAGPIVLEGTLVEPESPPRQRRRPSPRPRPDNVSTPLATDPPHRTIDDLTTAEAEHPPPDTEPSRPSTAPESHPARTAPAADRSASPTTADDDTGQPEPPPGDETVTARTADSAGTATADSAHAATPDSATPDSAGPAGPAAAAAAAAATAAATTPAASAAEENAAPPADTAAARDRSGAAWPMNSAGSATSGGRSDATAAGAAPIANTGTGRPAPDHPVRDPELDLDLEGDAPSPPPTAAESAPHPGNDKRTGNDERTGTGDTTRPATPPFSPVTTGIDEPPPPVTTGINGVDLADRPKSAADPEPAPADPPQNVAATPVPAPDSPKPVRPAPDSATPVSPAPRSRAPLDDVAAPVIPAPRNPAQDLPDQRESQKHTSRLDDIITAYPSARPGPAGAIHGIGLTVLVTDLDRSRRFYRDLLGFHEIDAGDGSAVLASGDTRLVLRRGTAVGTSRPIHLNLEVGDLDAMHAELLGKGVEFAHGPRVVNRGERLELWAAELDDPDGHNIAISQWRAVD